MYHGEYKTPGGKLIAVDFEIAGGRLSEVQVHGDFFMYPEEAFADLAASLEGAPADAGEEVFARRVREGLRPEADLLGSSPEGLATAVSRALASGPVEGA
jgi:lipoate---protein ligase